MPRVSIIAPVYKTEAYLDQCVKSVLAQTFEDYELILVDDGSPDNCPMMCDFWAEVDSRVKVIHKGNGGVSSARNAGLDAAQGEYVTFLDTDDFWSDDFLRNAVEIAEEANLDVYLAGSVFWKSEKKQQTYVIDHTITWDSSQLDEQILCQLLEKSYISSCWGMLLRADYIKQSYFESGCTFGEDLRFVFSLIERSGRMMADTKASYYYRDNQESATKQFDEKKIKDVVATYIFLNDFAHKRQFAHLKRMVENRWVVDCIYIQNLILGSSQPFCVQYRRLRLLRGNLRLRKLVLQSGEAQERIAIKAPGVYLVRRALRVRSEKMNRRSTGNKNDT